LKPEKFSMKRRTILLLAVVVVMAGMFFLWPRGPREPVYQGRRLTEWMAQGVPGTDPVTGLPVISDEGKARAAIEAIGTNALPFLLSEFTRPVSPRRERLRAWVNRQPYLNVHLRLDGERLYSAGQGLRLLGNNAAPAIPTIMRYLDDPDRNGLTIQILHGIGDASVDPLTSALSSTNSPRIGYALYALQMLAYSPGPGRDALAKALHHPSAEVREEAVQAWVWACRSNEVVVAELVKLANDPSPRVVWEVTHHLGNLSWSDSPRIAAAASNALLTLRTNASPPRTNGP
jgi:hypothetical protein